jgi:hypothetical protein
MKCTFCAKESYSTIEDKNKPACAHHYVQHEAEGCLMALLASNPPQEIIAEVKKQRPKIYEKYKDALEDN